MIFEYLTDSFSLSDNPVNNGVAMALIVVISYVITFALVGKLYSYNFIDGSGEGKILHWIIRLIVSTVIFYMAAIAIRVYSWFHVLPEFKWWIIGGIIGIIILSYGFVKIYTYRKTSKNIEKEQ